MIDNGRGGAEGMLLHWQGNQVYGETKGRELVKTFCHGIFSGIGQKKRFGEYRPDERQEKMVWQDGRERQLFSW